MNKAPKWLAPQLIGLTIIIVAAFTVILVSLNRLQSLDDRLLAQALNLPQSWLGFMTVISFIGAPLFVVVVAIAWALCELIIFKHWRSAITMLLSLLALPAYQLIKVWVHRMRPNSLFVIKTGLHSYSFPSGHAAGSWAVYAILAGLLYQQLRPPWGKVAAVILMTLIALIGFSRVYLGAHYPSDVVAGWLVGGLIWLVSRLVERALEKPDSPAIDLRV